MKITWKYGLGVVMAFISSATLFAAEPAGYYSSCENKSGKQLLSALCSKIGPHTTVSYKQLLTLYKTSDVYPEDGKIWDMYSTKHWNPGTTCGNYSVVGDCYNREHSFPKSWFDDASPMYSDAFHIYPTDGKVNGQRSNYPYGECANGTTLSSSGSVKALGKLGKSTFPGYSGTVFEPVDEYKGDFARSYFYMAAAYNDRISTWKSDMLANNSYPVFSSWAIQLLLKWHSEDPVSKKEIDRNEVVYGQQRNRNPFIDHPELVDHIWGNKADVAWTGSAEVEVSINKPTNGSTLNLGTTAVGYSLKKTVSVLTSNASSNVTVSVSGSGFSVSPTTLSATQANAGKDITITYLPTAVGEQAGVLTITAGTVKSEVTLLTKTVKGLPANEATEVSDRSFVANWTYVGDADAQGNYTLFVSDEQGLLPGYPKAVNAQAESFTVSGLDASTDYNYILKSNSLVSDYIFVRTGEAIPSVEFLFDGDLTFVTSPELPSESAEILIMTENIEGDYTVSVSSPFELSVDNTNWSTSLTLTPDDTRMYMRLNTPTPGTYETSITAVYGSYVNDDAMITGVVAATVSFLEDFEPTGNYGTYSPQTYYGSACTWNLDDAGIWSSDKAYSGSQALRAGKTANSTIEMAEDRVTGIGEVSFYAQRFGTDAEAVVAVEYSTDGGNTYRTAGKVTIDQTYYKEYKVAVKALGTVRMRIVQESGKRFLIDDIAITDAITGVDDPMAARHQWDAYSHSGTLFVNVKADTDIEMAIYSIDGSTLFSGEMTPGVNTFDNLTPGLVCIVYSGDFSRTVIIR